MKSAFGRGRLVLSVRDVRKGVKGGGLGTGVKASALPQQADQPTRSTNRLLGAIARNRSRYCNKPYCRRGVYRRVSRQRSFPPPTTQRTAPDPTAKRLGAQFPEAPVPAWPSSARLVSGISIMDCLHAADRHKRDMLWLLNTAG